MSSILKWMGFGPLLVFTVLGALFFAGHVLSDPGGWRGVGLVTLWAIPLVLLSCLAWWRPAWALPVLAVIAGVIVGVAVWYVIEPEGWRAWEDRTGPVRGILSLTAAAPMAVLGLKRTAVAGGLLLVIGAVPPALVMLTAGEVGWGYVAGSAFILSIPLVVSAILYLLAAATDTPPPTCLGPRDGTSCSGRRSSEGSSHGPR